MAHGARQVPQKDYPMKIKTVKVTIDGVETLVAVLDANGHVVLVGDDNSEVPADVPAMRSALAAANAESAERKTKLQEAETKLRAFDGIDDPAKAKAALATVGALDAKDLIAAGKAEEMKLEAIKAVQQQYEGQVTELKTQLEAAKGEAGQLKTTLHNNHVAGLFDKSAATEGLFLNKEVEIPVGFMQSRFRAHFAFDEDGKLVGYYDEARTKKVYSVSNPGTPAEFEEAIAAIVKAQPDKDHILKGKVGGGGGAGGGGGGGGDDDTNPFKPGGKGFNRTKQAELVRTNRDEAKRLADAAGVKVAGLNA